MISELYFHSIQYIFKSIEMGKLNDKLGVRIEVEIAQR